MPGVSILGARLWRELVSNPPEIAARRLHFDDVGAEVRQDHRGAGACDEARKIYHFQSRENVVACHGYPFQIAVCGGRFTDLVTPAYVSLGGHRALPSGL